MPVIALRPYGGRGLEILDKLEEQAEMKPIEVFDDGTRRYSATDASADAFNPMLDKIEGDWRYHVTNYLSSY
jgi:hypothetical protein